MFPKPKVSSASLLMSLNSSYNKVVKGGPSGMKKDF